MGRFKVKNIEIVAMSDKEYGKQELLWIPSQTFYRFEDVHLSSYDRLFPTQIDHDQCQDKIDCKKQYGTRSGSG